MNMSLLQNFTEHAAIAVAAVGGVLAARGKRIDLFGVVVLALVTAYGGGTVRDLLVGDTPVTWLRSPFYLRNATLIAIVAFAVARLREIPQIGLLTADAFALALFTTIGTAKGHSLALCAPVCVLLGLITGVAGGIVRDVLVGEVPLVFQPQIHLYATASLVGAAVFMGLKGVDSSNLVATLAGISTVLLLRLIGIRLKLSLPVFEPLTSAPTAVRKAKEPRPGSTNATSILKQ
jgi:uncharacterized membrane protein YeiH